MFLHKIHHHGRRIHHTLLRRLNTSLAIFVTLLFLTITTLTGFVLASTTVNLSMTILPQPLAADFVDSNYEPISEPEVVFPEATYTHDCREMVSHLATGDQQIYVRNVDTAIGGWTVTISAADPTSTWSSGNYHFDFNDPTGDGCEDGPDPDTLAGSMKIYTQPDGIDKGACSSCSVDFVNRVPVWIFDENTGINSVAIAYATADADSRGDWKLSDIIVRQTIPADQPASGQYDIPLQLTITAN